MFYNVESCNLYQKLLIKKLKYTFLFKSIQFLQLHAFNEDSVVLGLLRVLI